VTALASWLQDARRAPIAGASQGMNLAHSSAFNRYLEESVQAAMRN
jgi:hypothetical protein